MFFSQKQLVCKKYLRFLHFPDFNNRSVLCLINPVYSANLSLLSNNQAAYIIKYTAL